jgi:hypothetical protein
MCVKCPATSLVSGDLCFDGEKFPDFFGIDYPVFQTGSRYHLNEDSTSPTSSADQTTIRSGPVSIRFSPTESSI